MCTSAIILEQILVYVPLICGAYIILSLMKVPDMSLQNAFVCGAVCASSALNIAGNFSTNLCAGLAIGASVGGGALVGLVSSSITQIGRIPHLLSTIITSGVCYGLTLSILNGASRTLATNPLMHLFSITGNAELGALLVLGGMTVLGMGYFLRTQLGYACATYGDNPLFFSHYRSSTTYVFMIGCILSNALAGLSGYLFAQSCGFVDVSMGIDVILLCLTTLMIGKLLVPTHKKLTLIIPVGGIVLYSIVQHLLITLHLEVQHFAYMQAITILIIALIIFNHTKNHPAPHDHLGV